MESRDDMLARWIEEIAGHNYDHVDEALSELLDRINCMTLVVDNLAIRVSKLEKPKPKQKPKGKLE